MEKGNSIIKRAKKAVIFSIILLFFVSFVIMGLMIWSLWSFPQVWGSYDLGNGFYMIEYDQGRIIVYGTNMAGNTCFGGNYVIPSFEKSYTKDLQHRKLIVLDAFFDDSWIIAPLYDLEEEEKIFAVFNKKTIADNSEEYKESVYYFFDIQDLQNYCAENDINNNLLDSINEYSRR